MTTTYSQMPSGRPLPGEFASYAAEDIAHVAGDDAVAALASQRDRVLALLSSVNDVAVNGVTYAPGKWTLKDVIACARSRRSTGRGSAANHVEVVRHAANPDA